MWVNGDWCDIRATAASRYGVPKDWRLSVLLAALDHYRRHRP